MFFSVLVVIVFNLQRIKVLLLILLTIRWCVNPPRGHPFWPVFLSCFLCLPSAAQLVPLRRDAGFCFCSADLQRQNKTGKSCASAYTKRHARKNGPQSYIYIMQVICSLSFSCSEICLFRLPITGIMYFGLRQIAALPTRRTQKPKPQKNKAKVCKLRYWSNRSKKARVYKQPVMFVYF